MIFLEDNVAVPLDASSIKVRSPKDPSQKVAFVSLLENIEVEPSRPAAKVVVNARTGTIVIGGDVRVTPAAVTHGSLTVKIDEKKKVTATGEQLLMKTKLLQLQEMLLLLLKRILKLKKNLQGLLYLIPVYHYQLLSMILSMPLALVLRTL